MDRCSSFPLLPAPHFLFSIWTDLKRSEKIPGAPTWRWGEGIWLTGPSRLHRNSPQRANISSIRVFDQIRDPVFPITLRPPCEWYRIEIFQEFRKITIFFLLFLSKVKKRKNDYSVSLCNYCVVEISYYYCCTEIIFLICLGHHLNLYSFQTSTEIN